MRTLVIVLACAVAGAAHAEAPKPKKQRVAVTDIRAVQGISEGTATIVANIVVAEIEQLGRYSVIAKSDIASMIGFDKQKQLLGCKDDTSCLAEIGGALGVEYLFTGEIGKIGSRYNISFMLADAKRAKVVARENRFCEANEDALVDTAQQAVRAAFAKLTGDAATAAPASATAAANPAPPAATEPGGTATKPAETRTPTKRLVAYGLLGGGALAAAVGGVFGVSALNRYDDLKKLRDSGADGYATKYPEDSQRVKDAARLADVLYAAGGACLVAGGVLFFLSDGSEPVAVAPALTPGGAGAAVAGTF